MKFLDSKRIKTLVIGAAEDTSRVGRELNFSVCKDESGEIFPTGLRHGSRHQVQIDQKCPTKSKKLADIHTHPVMYPSGKGSLQSQAKLSYLDIINANLLKKTMCVAQKVKKTNEVVVKCITPKSIENLLDDMYRGNPKLQKSTKNDEDILTFYGRKMQFSEEKSKPYIKEKRFKLNDIESKNRRNQNPNHISNIN